MHKIILFTLLISQIAGFAQKQFNNGFSLSLGAEYFTGEEYLAHSSFTIFMDKPMYGVQMSYERRLGNFFSLQANAGYFIGFDSQEFNFIFPDGPEPGIPSTSTVKSVDQRFSAQLAGLFWAVERKKYAFTPGLAVAYGRTLMHKHKFEDPKSEIKVATKNQYINASVLFTNRFLLKSLRNRSSGNFGELQLLLTPYFSTNVFQKYGGISNSNSEVRFGGGLFVGLGLMF